MERVYVLNIHTGSPESLITVVFCVLEKNIFYKNITEFNAA